MPRRLLLALACLFAALLGTAPGAAAQGGGPDSAPGWAGNAPPARVTELPGGARLVRLESSELELTGRVEGLLVFRVGSVHDPRGRAGLTAVLAAALVRGGSMTWRGEVLADWLASHAARLEARSELETIELEFSVPLEHFDALFERVVSLLVSPAYPAPSLDEAKAELTRARSLGAGAPQQMAADLARRLALGIASPWNSTPSAASLADLQRMEVLGFHRAYLGQATLTLGLAAGREPSDLVARAGAQLTRVGRAASPPAAPEPRFVLSDATPIWLVDAPDLEMFELIVATPVPVDEPSVRALDLWVRSLNLRGGDDAVLRSAQRRLQGLHFERIDVRRSLFPFGWSLAGRAPVSEAVDASEAGYEALSGNPRRKVSAEPLDRVRGELQPQLTPREQLAQTTRDVAAGLAVRARRDELERMAEVPLEEVLRAVHTRLNQRPPVVVVVGPAEQLYAPLALLGPVAVHSGLVRPHGTPEALDLRARMLDALGGTERWARLIGVHLEGEQRSVGSERPTPAARWRDLVRRMVRIDQDENGVPATLMATPTGGWHRTMRSVYDLEGSRHGRLVRREERQLDQVLHDLVSDPATSVRLGREGRLDVLRDDRLVCWIEVADTGLPSRLGFDEGSNDPGLFAYSDWREEQGYLWPASVVREHDRTHLRWTRFVPVFKLLHREYARPVR